MRILRGASNSEPFRGSERMPHSIGSYLIRSSGLRAASASYRGAVLHWYPSLVNLAWRALLNSLGETFRKSMLAATIAQASTMCAGFMLDKLTTNWINSAPMKRFSPIRLVRNVAVITLAFWLAGAGCLLGCEGVAAAAPDQSHGSSSDSQKASTLVVEGDACASTASHSCCRRKSRASASHPTAPAPPAQKVIERDSSTTRLNESSTSGMKACPFAISRALSVVKVRDGQVSATAASFQALPHLGVREQKHALSTLSPLPNRGHTYLHCCSFLI